MQLPFRSDSFAEPGRLRSSGSQRTLGAVLAILVEAALVLVVISMGWINNQPKPKQPRLVSIAIAPQAEPAHAKPAKAVKPVTSSAASPQLVQPAAPRPDVIMPTPPKPVTPPAAIIPMSSNQMASFNIANLPRQARPAGPAKGLMGPANTGVPGDSKRVGTAPNGQPMYAASWYREPYDDELRGYLSTAQGPGWALIACKTVADFRVENCVGLDEYPDGSNIQRAVLAAAWQFRVRPPRINGVSQVGDWVRIRIDYTERRN